jgi:hypothetical protein
MAAKLSDLATGFRLKISFPGLWDPTALHLLFFIHIYIVSRVIKVINYVIYSGH